MNLFATPGLGSLMGGRMIAGGGQLALAVIGFGLVLLWFLKLMAAIYNSANYDFRAADQPTPAAHNAWVFWGLAVFAVAWIWSLFTSVSLWREAARNKTQPPATP
jgi:hypothetical protein